MPGPEAAADAQLVEDCLELYGQHYGRWGVGAPEPGGRVRIPRRRFLGLLEDSDAWLACAFDGDRLVGYCVAVRSELPERGRVAWVSQLVVHQTYRDSRIATRLLYSVWQFSDCYAWGLATANPFAVRALETATRRPCRARLITERAREVLQHVRKHVSYLPPDIVSDEEGRPRPRVDTEFFLDHRDIPEFRALAARGDRPWALGSVDDGEEWLACTFSDQLPQEVDDERLAELLTGADSIWMQAYEGMTLDNRHAWHTHSKPEIAQILAAAGLPVGATALDVGCGDGRHAKFLADAGLEVSGVDISAHLIDRAKKALSPRGAHLDVLDAREELPSGPFELVICLYDVLGSSARSEDDRRIVRNIADVLAPGGFLAASVMNDGATAPRLAAAHRPSSNSDFINGLERLSPSTTMEETGSIFDPDLLLLYNDVYYRKEQFQEADWVLPAELVVRDRRFRPSDLRELIEAAGLEVIEIRPVQSGSWDRSPSLDETDQRAKELLLFARKPL
jgi:2-polyprenyl-3-methyl-5-hydroxy-6-metoxy-1,4-benzoquinol methylase/GNAT superfamily N-acetyltransferase